MLVTPEVIHNGVRQLHTLVWSPNLLHHLWRVALSGVNRLETYTSLYITYT